MLDHLETILESSPFHSVSSASCANLLRLRIIEAQLVWVFSPEITMVTD